MACQWEDEQTGGHCPDLVRALHRAPSQKWFTFTNGAHIDSLDPVHLQPLVRLPRAVRRPPGAGSNPITRPSRGRRAGRLPGGDGPSRERRRHAARRTRSRRCRPTPRRLPLRGAARGPGAVRQRRRHVARPAARRRATPTPASSSRSRRFPVPGTTARTWYFGPGGALDRPAAQPQGHQLVHVQPEGAAAERLRDQHRRRRAVGQRLAVAVELEAEPGRHRGVLRLRLR